jgi:nucleotide-binding universal stress UspA family protein
MLNHILVPLDGNPGSEELLPVLRRLVGLGASKITLLRAELPVAVDEYSVVTEVVLDQSRKYLEDMRNRISDLKIPVDILSQIGPPAAMAIETAEAIDASMIVIGSPRSNRLMRFLLGSVPERIVQRSRIPVLVVPPAGLSEGTFERPSEPRPLRTILVPLHGAAGADVVLPRALELARPAHARLILASVLSPTDEDPSRETFEEAEEILYAAGARCAEAGVDFSVIVEYGDAVARILALCRERSVDWVAIATRGRSAISRWLLPSLTHRILRGVPLPVLTVHVEQAVQPTPYRTLSVPGHS